jgi:hypothetical protein
MAGKESRKIISRTDNLEVAQFNLKHPRMNLPGIEDELRKEFGLKDVVVTLALHYQLWDSFAMTGCPLFGAQARGI